MGAHQVIGLDPIDAFRSWEDDETKAVRRRLLKARDISALRGTRAVNGQVRNLFWDANDIANRWCFAPATVDDLRDIANTLVRLFQAATLLERLESPHGD